MINFFAYSLWLLIWILYIRWVQGDFSHWTVHSRYFLMWWPDHPLVMRLGCLTSYGPVGCKYTLNACELRWVGSSIITIVQTYNLNVRCCMWCFNKLINFIMLFSSGNGGGWFVAMTSATTKSWGLPTTHQLNYSEAGINK